MFSGAGDQNNRTFRSVDLGKSERRCRFIKQEMQERLKTMDVIELVEELEDDEWE